MNSFLRFLRIKTHYEQKGVLVFVIGWTLLSLFGCGEDIDPPANDLTFRRQLIGEWDVVSVNDMEPSRFLTVLMVEPLTEGSSGDVAVPAAPDGEFVIIADRPEVVYHVKPRVSEFLYGFREDASWVLGVRFWVYPNDAATPVGEDATDASGDTQGDPIDPEKPAAPAVNDTSPHLVANATRPTPVRHLGVVNCVWRGTYQVLDGMLILTVKTEEVEVTPTSHPDTKAFFESISAAAQDDSVAALTEKFRVRLVTPFSKTFITVNDVSSRSLSIPGSSGGTIRLERYDPEFEELIQCSGLSCYF